MLFRPLGCKIHSFVDSACKTSTSLNFGKCLLNIHPLGDLTSQKSRETTSVNTRYDSIKHYYTVFLFASNNRIMYKNKHYKSILDLVITMSPFISKLYIQLYCLIISVLIGG